VFLCGFLVGLQDPFIAYLHLPHTSVSLKVCINFAFSGLQPVDSIGHLCLYVELMFYCFEYHIMFKHLFMCVFFCICMPCPWKAKILFYIHSNDCTL
jgi:hypothetical protein